MKRKILTTNIVDQVKHTVGSFKNLELGIVEEREKRALPITRELNKFGQQITDINKRQDEMIDKLGMNQLALMYHQSPQAIEAPQALETPKEPNQPKQPVTLNSNKRFGTEFQNVYGLASIENF